MKTLTFEVRGYREEHKNIVKIKMQNQNFIDCYPWLTNDFADISGLPGYVYRIYAKIVKLAGFDIRLTDPFVTLIDVK